MTVRFSDGVDRRFFSRTLHVISEYVAALQLGVRTLPTAQLQAEFEAVRAERRPGEIGPADLVAAIYASEARRRGLW